MLFTLSFVFLFFAFFDTTAEAGRNRKSTWVSIQIMWFGSKGLLATESQFWLVIPPACSCGSRIP